MFKLHIATTSFLTYIQQIIKGYGEQVVEELHLRIRPILEYYEKQSDMKVDAIGTKTKYKTLCPKNEMIGK